MKITMLKGTLTLFVMLAPAFAQQPPEPVPMTHPGFVGATGQGIRDFIAEAFFPPDLVMKQARAINLTQQQQKTIKEEMQKAQATFVDLQWQVAIETDVLAEILRKADADEDKILTQVEKIMTIENAIKKAHLLLLLRIKKALTSEQQEKLRHAYHRMGHPQPTVRMPSPDLLNERLERRQMLPPESSE